MGFGNDYPANEIVADLQEFKKQNIANVLHKTQIRSIGLAVTIANQKNAEKALKLVGATPIAVFINKQTSRKNTLWSIPLL